MAVAASAIRLAVNPANPAQMLRLWNNGVIDPIGGVGTPSGNPTWFDGTNPARAIQIIDWSTPSGYTLDALGIVHQWGGATGVGAQINGNAGFVLAAIAVDFAMDPNNTGYGYVLDNSGLLWQLGGTYPINTGLYLYGLAKRLVHNPASTNWVSAGGAMYVLDGYGGVHAVNAAPMSSTGAYWPTQDIARDLLITDWTIPQGYTLDGWGGVHPLNGADAASGGPYWLGWDIARDLSLIGANPTKYALLDGQGGVHVWSVSNPPTATAGIFGPPSPVTDTTRPPLTFGYADVDGDTMSKARVILYRLQDTASFVDEQQTIAATGATGGNFALSLEGHSTTGLFSRIVSAATMQANIRTNWPNCSLVEVTGGPLNVAPLVIKYKDLRGQCRQILPKAVTNTISGAALTITRTVAGTSPDAQPQLATAIQDTTFTDPNVRSLPPTQDFDNGNYAMFVKVWDSSGLASGWSATSWNQNVTRPSKPMLNAIDQKGLGGVALGVSLVSPPAGALVDVQYTDQYDPGAPQKAKWASLRGFQSQIGATTTGGTTIARGTMMGFTGYADTTNLYLSAAQGSTWLRYFIEQDYEQSSSGVWRTGNKAARQAEIDAAHANGLRLVTGSMGCAPWNNANSNVARAAQVGSHSTTCQTAVASVAALPASLTLANAAGYNLKGFARIVTSGTAAIIGYDSLVGNVISSIWLVSGTGAITAGALAQDWRPAISASSHWFPTDAAKRLNLANYCAEVALMMDPTKDIFELGNEPNIDQFNRGIDADPNGPYYQSPAVVAASYKAIIIAVRAAVPSMRIAMAGMAASGDVHNPDPAAYYRAMHIYAGQMFDAEPTLLTTNRPDMWSVHTYGFGGGNAVGDQSSPISTHGWNGYVQSDYYQYVLAIRGVPNAKMFVTECGGPGARAQTTPGAGNAGTPSGSSDAVVAQGYPEDWQYVNAGEHHTAQWTRIADGRLVDPVITHTLREDTTEATDNPDRYLSVYRADNSEKPAGTLMRLFAAERITTGGTTTGGGGAIVDAEAPFGKPRFYRAQVYTPAPYLSSGWSDIEQAILTGNQWVLSIPGNAFSQVVISVAPPFQFTRNTVQFVADPVGAPLPVVVSDGGLRGMTATLKVRTLSGLDYDRLQAILEWSGPILLRDILGRAWYCKVQDVQYLMMKAGLVTGESPEQLLRHAHEIDVKLIQVASPLSPLPDINASFFVV